MDDKQNGGVRPLLRARKYYPGMLSYAWLGRSPFSRERNYARRRFYTLVRSSQERLWD